MKVLKEAVRFKTFKQLVDTIASISSKEDFDAACGEIDSSFQHDKINWKDHELLYKLISRVSY